MCVYECVSLSTLPILFLLLLLLVHHPVQTKIIEEKESNSIKSIVLYTEVCDCDCAGILSVCSCVCVSWYV